MLFERRDMLRYSGDGQQATEDANERPKYNHQRPELGHCFTSMAEEMGHRIWISVPSGMRDEPVEEDIDIDL